MNDPFDLQVMKHDVRNLSENYFERIINLPAEVRRDTKTRTGIQILIKEVDTKNLICFPVNFPSEQAQHFVHEKAIRSEFWNHSASQNSENPELFQYRGSVTVCINGKRIQSSTSGLMGDEDVFISIVNLAHVTGLSVKEVIKNIKTNDGLLPSSFNDKKHYLHQMLEELN